MRKVAQLRLDRDLVCGYIDAAYRLWDYEEPTMISTLLMSLIPGHLESIFARSSWAHTSPDLAWTLWKTYAH